MRIADLAGAGRRANTAFDGMAGRVDARTGEAAAQAARVIALAVRLLRIPSAIVLMVPAPFVLATLVLALSWSGAPRVVGLVLVALMASLSTAFALRRRNILRAVDDPVRLGTELGIAVAMSGRVDETRGALTAIAGGGGWRIFSRLGGVWRGAGMTSRWIDGVGDLPHARFFVPPKLGTTVTVAMAALFLVPTAMVVCLFAAIGTLASAF